MKWFEGPMTFEIDEKLPDNLSERPEIEMGVKNLYEMPDLRMRGFFQLEGAM